MPRSQLLTTAARKIPAVRESSHLMRAAAATAADVLHYALTGRTFAAARLEHAFSLKPDPWNFAHSDEEAARFRKTWALVPPRPYQSILEIGCAEGHFTEQIAARFPGADIMALDFVPLALQRARVRCSAHPNVRFDCLDVGKQPIAGSYDLIFCMGVLEYGPAPAELERVRRSIVDALAPGGCLVVETRAMPADLQRRWWAQRLSWGARVQHDRFLSAGLAAIDEAFVCGDARMTTVFVKAGEC